MPTTLQPKILLATFKYDFKVVQRENSPNEVQKWYPRGTNFLGYKLFKWGAVPQNGIRLATLISTRLLSYSD